MGELGVGVLMYNKGMFRIGRCKPVNRVGQLPEKASFYAVPSILG